MKLKKPQTASSTFGLGSTTAASIAAAPIDVTLLPPNLYYERSFSTPTSAKPSARRLLGVCSLRTLRNLFQHLLLTIDTGNFDER